jgi:hypothetical protein
MAPKLMKRSLVVAHHDRESFPVSRLAQATVGNRATFIPSLIKKRLKLIRRIRGQDKVTIEPERKPYATQ